MAVLIDTSVLVAIEREWMAGRQGTLSKHLPTSSAISAITLLELRIGMLLADTERRRSSRAAFSDDVRSRFPTLPFAEREAAAAAEIMVSLRRQGERIGERDLLIAATAVANGHSMLTLNHSEFARVPGLILESSPELGLA